MGEQEVFKPEGGGGTDFRPFFKEMEKPGHDGALLIYFTDGYGTFPDNAPQQELLWILNSEGWKEGLQEIGEICSIKNVNSSKIAYENLNLSGCNKKWAKSNMLL